MITNSLAARKGGTNPIKGILFSAVLSLLFTNVEAQVDTKVNQKKPAVTAPVTYMMPDGSLIAKDKIDSVDRSWNGALMLGHDAKDQAQGVIHIFRLSEENMKQIAAQNAKADSAVKVLVGKMAPEFQLTDIGGRQWSTVQLRGKVIVLNFWYTSCPPCNAEMPDLNELTKKYDPAKVVFLALTFNDAQKVKTYLESHEFAYHIIAGTKPTDQKYRISGWPTSLVVNKAGLITHAVNMKDDIKADLSAAIEADL
ncbi:peroxiredoxin [Pedobacter sp. L105]|uniref:peroxiredoxin family protein n=1 Tax=Pedobacter sp. L105 TaxID=1641871 RepID=UPI00131C1AD1|nr:TlpA disulfide reductase family protein [Pedobacter sp. L105]